MSINLTVPATQNPDLRPKITVIGVGGAGGNAVDNMIRSGLEGVEFLVVNSDAQALSHSAAERRIQLGTGITGGLGAGSDPAIGQAAAEESLAEVLDALAGSNMVFITAGLGGGTGTGAAPVIAQAAREQGILTVGVVTKPFQFEGAKRMRTAEAGLEKLQQFVDTLLVIPNQNLFRVANEKTTFADAFKMADDVLHSGVRGVTDLMMMPGLINLDFADIRSVMGEMGKAMMGTGEAEGEKRALEAAEAAIANPLLDDISMAGARGVLINITAGSDITLFEVDEAANRIREEVDAEANIIFGSTFDESLEGRMRVSVVATGIDVQAGVQAPPTVLKLVDEEAKSAAKTMPAAAPADSAETAESAPAPAPAPRRVAAVAAQQGSAAIADAAIDGATEAIAEPAIVASAGPAGDAFIPPPPADGKSAASPPPAADPFAAADMANPPADGKRRGLSLFERVTGVGRGDREDTAPAARMEDRKEPVMPAAGPEPEPETDLDAEAETEAISAAPGVARDMAAESTPESTDEAVSDDNLLGRMETADDGPLEMEDDGDLLDIPAFLRRQAN